MSALLRKKCPVASTTACRVGSGSTPEKMLKPIPLRFRWLTA